MKSCRALIYASLFTVLLAATAFAADLPASTPADPQANPADPPGRVARLEYMSGQVSIQPAGTGDWVEASTNRPLTNSDNVWADKDSRAELNLGTSRLRIGSETSLTLTHVNNDTVQVSLHQGALNVHIRQIYGGETYEVDTQNLAFTITKAGDYRFDVDPNADTTVVTVRKGEGEATGQGPAVRVHAGQHVTFNNGTSLANQVAEAPSPDGFDDWCRVRDEREEHSVSARYVAPGVVGADDLDDYGTWKDTPDYGPVWVPTVDAGWAPYAYGNWEYVGPWGWTWVDAAPWGFAPFHYGRWVWWGGYWGWAPGPYWVRPWYAPALVGWWGGPGWGVGFGFGFGFGFGWCPLGWGEPFFPWYHVSPFYFRNVNITNTRIVNFNHFARDFANGRVGQSPSHFANFNRGFTAVSHNTLERGSAIHGSEMKVSANDLKGAQSLSHVDAKPTGREATLGPKAGQAAARPAAGVTSRPTVSRMTPPTSARTGETQGLHNTEAAGARNGENTARSAQPAAGQRSAAVNTPSSAGRSVPRPPQSFGRSSSQSAPARSETSQMASNHNVPRPPQSSMRSPSETSHSTTPNSSRQSSPSFGSHNVPRPTGSVQPAPRDYSRAGSRGESYSSRAYGGYGSSHNYGSPRSWGSRYGGSYGGRSYSAPSHSYGSSGGYHGSSGSHGSSGGFHGGSGGHGGGGHR